MIEAVTFDYWNTLVATSDEILYQRRAEHWVAVLAEAGHDVSPNDVSEAFKGSWRSFREAWHANQQYVTADGVGRVLELLGVPADDGVATTLVEHYGAGALEAELSLAPNVTETLSGLKDAGVRLGIICDVGMTPSTALRAALEQFGVMDRFDHHSFSDDVGVYKPDPAIFAHALAGLGSTPATSAHVGDLRRTDVAGALGAGWTAVRYAGLHDDDGAEDDTAEVEADVVIRDHAELPRALGLS
jgi:putative hydrolase of the HAD superfamily